MTKGSVNPSGWFEDVVTFTDFDTGEVTEATTTPSSILNTWDFIAKQRAADANAGGKRSARYYGILTEVAEAWFAAREAGLVSGEPSMDAMMDLMRRYNPGITKLASQQAEANRKNHSKAGKAGSQEA